MPDHAAPASPLAQLSAVYVEDDPDTQILIGRAMGRRLGETHLAGNGHEGLELVRAHDPDIVVTDLEMPVMDGLEMIRRIRDDFGYSKPVLVVTAYNDEEHRTELADGYVLKPVVLGELFSTIEALIEKQGLGTRD